MSLSDRIRPDCEAAPWVIKEVKEMESRIEFWIEKSTMQAIQISGMETEIQILKAENARYREALFYISEASWKDYPRLSDALDGDYLGDHYSEIATEALKGTE